MSNKSNDKTKKYFWLKLDRNFFKRHDILVIESMPNGKDYVLFYMKLLLESIDHEGALRFSDTIPYNAEMLSTITNTNIDTVRSAIKLFEELHLMEVLDDHTIYLSETHKMLGEGTSTERVRRFRERQRVEQLETLHETDNKVTVEGVKNHDNREIEKSETLHETELEIEIELEIDKEIDKEIEIKDIYAHWNELEIIKHRALTKSMIGRIKTKLKDYSYDEVITAISNYSKILKSDQYYFTHRWTLVEFMDRGFDKMFDWDIAQQSYQSFKTNKKSTNGFLDMLEDENDT